MAGKLTVDFITNRVFNSRTYIISSTDCDRVWLVDCGDTDMVLELIGEKGVEGVLLTHAHSDHIYGLEELIKRFPSVKVYTNVAGVEALRSPKLNLSHYHSEYPDISIEAPENIHVLAEGNTVDVLGFAVKVYETPGHSPSCITYIVDDMAFTGDAYIPEVKVFTGFPQSNRKQAVLSEERIKQLTKNCSILSGHTILEGTQGLSIG